MCSCYGNWSVLFNMGYKLTTSFVKYVLSKMLSPQRSKKYIKYIEIQSYSYIILEHKEIF